MNYEEDLGIHSEEVQEVLGTPPRWIVRWGTTIAFLLFLILAWLAWIVKYPEKIEAPITITSAIPPTDIIAQEKGYINQLFKNNNDTVRQGDLLGIIQSTTNYEDMTALEAYLKRYDRLRNNANTRLKAPLRDLELGENVQRAYSNFVQAYEDYTLNLEGSSTRSNDRRYDREVDKIEQDIAVEEERLTEAQQRLSDLEDILETKQTQYANREIPLSELENTTDQIAIAKQRIDEYNESIRSKQLDIQQTEGQRAAAAQGARQDNKSSYVALKESVKQLHSEIEAWRQKYLLVSPSEGVVTYFGSKQTALRFVEQGEIIMAILPLKTTLEAGQNGIVGRVSLPIEGSGKVKEGQAVKVRLDSYPAHEYGLVEGIIVQKARLPRNRTYNIEVKFPQGLDTSFDNDISFDQQMTGTAMILTGRQRFAERIFEKFIEMFEVPSKM